MKVRSSSKRPYLWGNADDVAHRHQVCHKQVYGCLRYNNEESSDIPQRVSGSSETKTYGKDAIVRAHDEQQTLPRRSFFGKDREERSRVFQCVASASLSHQ